MVVLELLAIVSAQYNCDLVDEMNCNFYATIQMIGIVIKRDVWTSLIKVYWQIFSTLQF